MRRWNPPSRASPSPSTKMVRPTSGLGWESGAFIGKRTAKTRYWTSCNIATISTLARAGSGLGDVDCALISSNSLSACSSTMLCSLTGIECSNVGHRSARAHSTMVGDLRSVRAQIVHYASTACLTVVAHAQLLLENEVTQMSTRRGSSSRIKDLNLKPSSRCPSRAVQISESMHGAGDSEYGRVLQAASIVKLLVQRGADINAQDLLTNRKLTILSI